MTRYGMVIDLETCVGCHSCTIACKVSNGTPPGVHFASVIEHEVGTYPNARREFLPVLCNHCEDAPCVDVCPTGASYKRADGIVAVHSDICIGCRACDTACPYGHRHYIEPGALRTGYFNDGLTKFEELKYERWTDGTVSKCDFCMERTDQGLQPACVETCPPISRHFGDLSDPDSNVSRLLRERESFTLLPEAGTEPRVSYLKPRSASRRIAGGAALEEADAGAIWAAALQGGRKGFSTGVRYIGHMGGLEAFSFYGESLGGALFVLAVIAGMWPPAVLGIGLVGLAVIALLAHLGRPLRSWRAISRPGRSWISRGTLAIAAFIPFAVLSLLATPLREAATFVALALAVMIAFYGGLLLRSYRAIRFWRGPFLPLGFAAQGFASAATLLTAWIALFDRGHAASQWLPGLSLAFVLAAAAFAALHWSCAERSTGVRASKERLRLGDLRKLFTWGAATSGFVVPTVALSLLWALEPSSAGELAAFVAVVAAASRLWGDFAYRATIVRAGAYEPLVPHS